MRIINKNNKGVALISVMITILFLSIVATAMLYISMSNFSMKYSNIKGKQNFYDADATLVKTMTGIRQSTMHESDPKSAINNLKTTNDDSCDTYSVNYIASLAYPTVSGATYKVTGNTVTLDPGSATDPSKNKEKIVFSSDNNKIEAVPNATAGVTDYILHDIKITRTSKDGYKNTVKTDLKFSILETTSASSSSGGVGNMSLLIDNSLNMTEGNDGFKCLTLEGNVFMADYKTTPVSWNGHQIIAPGNNALIISSESKLNLKGDNNVVYGDIRLSNGASLIVYGNLTVYGDIYISNNSNLVIAEGGNLYMLDSPLPDRSGQSKVNGNSHIPSTLTIGRLTDEQFTSFSEAIGTLDPTGNNYGLINKIFAETPEFLNKKIIDCNEITNINCNNGNTKIEKFCRDKGRGYRNKTTNNNTDNGIFPGSQYTATFKPFNFMDYSFGFNIICAQQDLDSMNGKYNHLLMIVLPANGNRMKFQESNPFTTWITKNKIYGRQRHGVTMSKVGTSEFNYMTAAKGDSESAAYNDDSKNPYNSLYFDIQGGGVNAYGHKEITNFKFGTLFKSTCNKSVDDMFSSSTTGTGTGPKSYVSAMSFENYVRDFE